MNKNNSQQIIILGTGGTIAGEAVQAQDHVGYTAALVGVAQLVAAIPALRGLDGGVQYGEFELISEQVAQVDSKDMTFAVWQRLLARCAHWLAQPSVAGVVITHGTDTLEETAYFLQTVLNPAKPLVLTCAMRPSTAIAADGPQNLLDALAVAAYPGARGVLAVCAGTIHSAVDVQKVHPYRLDAFSSGDAGPVGAVAGGGLFLYRNWPENVLLAGANSDPDAMDKIAKMVDLPRVEIVLNHAGARGSIVDALLASSLVPQARAGDDRLRGIVVAATGNGTISTDLEVALHAAQAAGVVVCCSTRCVFGRVLGKAGAEFGDAHGLSPVKARIALMLQLALL